MLRGLFEGPGWIIVLAVILLLFGATRLPALARSIGQSTKIFREEMKTEKPADPAASDVTSAAATPVTVAQPVAQPVSPAAASVAEPAAAAKTAKSSKTATGKSSKTAKS